MEDLANDLRELERRVDRLDGVAEELVREHGRLRAELAELGGFLDLAPKAGERLEELSRELFGEILDELESNLSHAVREVLGQERQVLARREVRGGKLFVTLEIENQGQVEDILHGQGGSVCNILSVGLRLIALSQLDPAKHRPFLVLDEQDCWLRPELVPKFVRLISKISLSLGIQTLYISHHPVDSFAGDARKVYGLKANREKGVELEVLRDRADEEQVLLEQSEPDEGNE